MKQQIQAIKEQQAPSSPETDPQNTKVSDASQTVARSDQATAASDAEDLDMSNAAAESNDSGECPSDEEHDAAMSPTEDTRTAEEAAEDRRIADAAIARLLGSRYGCCSVTSASTLPVCWPAHTVLTHPQHVH